MKILVTGNMGYVGSALTRHLRSTFDDAELIGYDSGFFAHCITTPEGLPEVRLQRQHFGDVRELPEALLKGVDGVVHLAAVSNDPMGNRFEAPTEEINYAASVAVAERARNAGVKNFVFASSCSIYGFAEDGPRKETDPLNPLTAYARSKIGTEQALAQIDPGEMVVTCLRFATACGMSDRLRLDLVLNDFVACALALREITVLSDGLRWRPLIDVSDMARAIEWAITRPADERRPLSRRKRRVEWLELSGQGHRGSGDGGAFPARPFPSTRMRPPTGDPTASTFPSTSRWHRVTSRGWHFTTRCGRCGLGLSASVSPIRTSAVRAGSACVSSRSTSSPVAFPRISGGWCQAQRRRNCHSRRTSSRAH